MCRQKKVIDKIKKAKKVNGYGVDLAIAQMEDYLDMQKRITNIEKDVADIKTLQVTPLNEGSGLLEFKLTGDSGTFTDDEVALIKSLNTALIFINDGQCFRLTNMAEDLGYRTYVNVDCALSSSPVVQAIYVQLDPISQNYKKWTKEVVE